MEDMRRKLDMAEGSKSALQTQVRVSVYNTKKNLLLEEKDKVHKRVIVYKYFG